MLNSLKCRFSKVARLLPVYFAVICLPCALFSASDYNTYVKNVSNLKTQLIKLKLEEEKVQKELHIAEEEAEKLSSEIYKLKALQQKDSSFFRGLSLQQKLQKSVKVEEQLKEKEIADEKIQKAIITTRTNLLKAYDKIISILGAQLKSKKIKKSSELYNIMSSYNNYVKEKEKLSELNLKLDIPKLEQIAQIEVSPLDSKSEIQEKVDVLSNIEERIKEKLGDINSKLNELKSRRDLMSEVKQFVDETFFFSDEFAIARVTQNKPNTTDENNNNTSGSSSQGTGSGNTSGQTDTSGQTQDGSQQGSDTTGGAQDQTQTDGTTTGDQTTTDTTDVSGTADQAAGTEQTTTTDTTTTLTDTTSLTETSSSKDTPFKTEMDINRLSQNEDASAKGAIKQLTNEKNNLSSQLRQLQTKIKQFKQQAKEREY